MPARKSSTVKTVKQTRNLQKAAGAAEPKRRRAYLPASERRALIIQAAQEVFSRTNLQGARTRDIAKAAEVNQATVFEHFDSKETLFQEAVVQPLLDAMRGMHERGRVYETASSAEEIAKLAQPSALRQLESMVQIFPLFTAAMFSDQELGRKLYQEQIAPIIKARSEAISGIVKDSLDPEFVDLANFGIIFAIAMDHVFKGKAGDLLAAAAQLTEFATGGFVAAEPEKRAAKRAPKPRGSKKK